MDLLSALSLALSLEPVAVDAANQIIALLRGGAGLADPTPAEVEAMIAETQQKIAVGEQDAKA